MAPIKILAELPLLPLDTSSQIDSEDKLLLPIQYTTINLNLSHFILRENKERHRILACICTCIFLYKALSAKMSLLQISCSYLTIKD